MPMPEILAHSICCITLTIEMVKQLNVSIKCVTVLNTCKHISVRYSKILLVVDEMVMEELKVKSLWGLLSYWLYLLNTWKPFVY
jgi:hypothetical protein